MATINWCDAGNSSRTLFWEELRTRKRGTSRCFFIHTIKNLFFSANYFAFITEAPLCSGLLLPALRLISVACPESFDISLNSKLHSPQTFQRILRLSVNEGLLYLQEAIITVTVSPWHHGIHGLIVFCCGSPGAVRQSPLQRLVTILHRGFLNWKHMWTSTIKRHFLERALDVFAV